MTTITNRPYDPSDPVDDLLKRGQFEEAYRRSRPLAEAGSVHAQLLLGWMHQTGQGASKNLESAKGWYLRAARSHSAQAQFYFGSVLWCEGNFDEARSWFEKAAAGGYPPAAYHLGRMYRDGVGVRADQQKACHFMERAANQGHLFARRYLARETLKGRRGFWRIPLGLVAQVTVALSAYQVARANPNDDRLLRL